MSVTEHEAPGARTASESTEAEAAQNVQAMFNSIAPRYDQLNHLISMGLDRRWWRRTAQAFAPTLRDPRAKVLDICCGTGDQTAALLALRPQGAEPVVGLDFSAQMLARARVKYPSPEVQWMEGDALHLPFPNNSLDLVTAAFGFRNLSNYAEGLAEMARVLRPGGQIGILEANQPTGLNALIYNTYFHRILPLVGGILSGQREAYRYLPASVERFPRPPQMLRMMEQAGFTEARWDGYLFHAAGLYIARKSGTAGSV